MASRGAKSVAPAQHIGSSSGGAGVVACQLPQEQSAACNTHEADLTTNVLGAVAGAQRAEVGEPGGGCEGEDGLCYQSRRRHRRCCSPTPCPAGTISLQCATLLPRLTRLGRRQPDHPR